MGAALKCFKTNFQIPSESKKEIQHRLMGLYKKVRNNPDQFDPQLEQVLTNDESCFKWTEDEHKRFLDGVKQFGWD